MTDFYQSGENFDKGLFLSKSHTKIIAIFMVFVLSGCAYTQNSYPEKSFKLAIDKNYKASLLGGTVTAYDTTNKLIYYNVVFDKVKGGETYLFGIWKIKESSGYKADRIIFENSEERLSFSIDDLENAKSNLGIIYLPLINKQKKH